MTEQTVHVRKVLFATCEEVFDAWLDAEGMAAWMRPGPVESCEVALEPYVGGHFRIVMRTPEAVYLSTGEFLILERPHKLQFTWSSSRWNDKETLVTLELKARGESCEVLLTHERFPIEHSSVVLESGWNDMLDKLSLSLTDKSK